MSCISEWIHNCRPLVRNSGIERYDVYCRNFHKFCKLSIDINPDSNSVFTYMLFSATTVATMTASQMALSGNYLTYFQIGHSGAHLFDMTHILMTNNHRCPYSFLGPFIPFINMKVGTTNGRLFDLYNYIIQPRFGNRNFLHP